jgi:hypothetical protein
MGNRAFCLAAREKALSNWRCANSNELTRPTMSARAFSAAVLGFLALIRVTSSANALTENEIVARLESAGYSQVRPVPSGKIRSFKAVKDGKDVSVIVDSSGHIKEVQ